MNTLSMGFGTTNHRGQDWEYEWEIEKQRMELSIVFIAPMFLPKTQSKDKILINSVLDSNCIDDNFVKVKIDALLFSKYNTKIKV